MLYMWASWWLVNDGPFQLIISHREYSLLVAHWLEGFALLLCRLMRSHVTLEVM